MTEKKKKTPPTKLRPEPLNDEAMKGIWVDGIEYMVGPHYTILNGIIAKPRSEKPIIATRIMFPTKILHEWIKTLSKALEELEKKKSKRQ